MSSVICVATLMLAWAACHAARMDVALELAGDEAASSAIGGDECAAILQNGIRNSVRQDLRTSNFYEAQEMLKKYDETYSYDRYKEDFKQDKRRAFDESASGKISGSYGLYSGKASGGWSSGQSAMSRAEFDTQSKKIQRQKKALETSSSSSGRTSQDMANAAETVSPEIVSAWRDCMSFQAKDIKVKLDVDESGRTVTVIITNNDPLVPAKLTGFFVAPSRAAKCNVIGGKLAEDNWLFNMPDDEGVDLERGRPRQIFCMREKGFENDRVKVTLFTDVRDADHLAVDFADVVTPTLADDVASTLKEMDAEMTTGLRNVRADLQGVATHLAEQVTGLAAEVEAVKVGVTVKVIDRFISISKSKTMLHPGMKGIVNYFDKAGDAYIIFDEVGGEWVDASDFGKLKGAITGLAAASVSEKACAFCDRKCGGSFPNTAGALSRTASANGVWAYGNKCTGTMSWIKNSPEGPRLCCK